MSSPFDSPLPWRQTTLRRLFLISGSGLILLVPPVFSQDNATDDEEEEDVFEMNPFVVTTEKDSGYLSTNSTAGTSLNLLIKDIPVSLEVLNREMLDDMQATNLEESLIYSAGVFTDNYRANGTATAAFADISPSAIGNFDDPFQNLVSIRGYSVPNQQRAGFRVGGIVNAYGVVLGGSTDGILTERTEIVRGPQSLLYGINVLSGVTNIEPKRPLAEFRYAGSVMVGNNNEFRGTLDVTGPIVEDYLNFRVLGAVQQFDDKDQIENRKYDRATYAVQFDVYPFGTSKTRIFLEYVNAEQNSEGIGPKSFGTSTIRDEWDEAFDFGRDDPTRPLYVPDSPDDDLFDTYFQDHDLSHLGFYAADGVEDGPLVRKPGNEAYYDFTDLGYTFNIAGPDTYKTQKEENFLAQIYHSFTDQLFLELGVYHTDVEIEEFNINTNTQWNSNSGTNIQPQLRPSSFLDRTWIDWLENPEVIAADGENDRIGFGVGEAFLLPFTDTFVPLLDPNYAVTTYEPPEAASDAFGSRWQSDINIDRVYAYYWWYKRPSSSSTNQARGRLNYSIKSDFWKIRATHNFVAGYHFIEDDVRFITSTGQAGELYSPGTPSLRRTEPYNGRLDIDPIIFRESVFDTTPIRYNGEPIAFANNLNFGNLGGLDSDLTSIGRSGHKEVKLWFRGAYGIYHGKYLDDKLTVIAGFRHDAYQGKEREQLLFLDRNRETENWIGGVSGQPYIPQLYGVYGNEPWTNIPEFSDELNASIAASIEELRAVQPNGTEEHIYNATQKFNTKTFSASYRVTEAISAYAAYSEGVFPNTGFRDGAYNPIEAEQTESREIGFKFDLMKGKISGTLSFWQIRRHNAITRWLYAPTPAKWHGGEQSGGFNGSANFSPLNTFKDLTYQAVESSPYEGGNLRPPRAPDPDDPDDLGDPGDPNASPYRGGQYWPLSYGISPRYYERALELMGLPPPLYGLEGRSIEETDLNAAGHNDNGEVIDIFDRGGVITDSGGPRSSRWIIIDYEKALNGTDPETNVWKRAFELAMQDAEVHGLATEANDIYSGELGPFGGAGINWYSFSDPSINNPSGRQGGFSNSVGNATLITFEEEGNGIDGQVIYTPLPQWQIVFNFSHQKREVVGNGLNLVDPIGPDGQGGTKNWGTEYDVWVYLLGAENFEDPTRPSTYNGDSVRGLDLSYVPRDSAGLLTHYTFKEGIFKNLRIGGGMQYEGEVITAAAIGGTRLDENNYLPPNRPERYVFNTFMRYGFNLWEVDWSLQLNVNNIFDHWYDVETITYVGPLDTPIERRTQVYYQPRTWRLSVGARF